MGVCRALPSMGPLSGGVGSYPRAARGLRPRGLRGLLYPPILRPACGRRVRSSRKNIVPESRKALKQQRSTQCLSAHKNQQSSSCANCTQACLQRFVFCHRSALQYTHQSVCFYPVYSCSNPAFVCCFVAKFLPTKLLLVESTYTSFITTKKTASILRRG